METEFGPRMNRGNGMMAILALGAVGIVALVLFAQSSNAAYSNNAGSYAAHQQAGLAAAPAQNAANQPVGATSPGGGVQDVYVKALGTGSYDNPYIRVKAGVPVRLHFSASPDSGCGRVLVMRNFGVTLVSRNGEEQTAEFTPGAGKFEFACSMRMFRGTLEAY